MWGPIGRVKMVGGGGGRRGGLLLIIQDENITKWKPATKTKAVFFPPLQHLMQLLQPSLSPSSTPPRANAEVIIKRKARPASCGGKKEKKAKIKVANHQKAFMKWTGKRLLTNETFIAQLSFPGSQTCERNPSLSRCAVSGRINQVIHCQTWLVGKTAFPPVQAPLLSPVSHRKKKKVAFFGCFDGFIGLSEHLDFLRWPWSAKAKIMGGKNNDLQTKIKFQKREKSQKSKLKPQLTPFLI